MTAIPAEREIYTFMDEARWLEETIRYVEI